MFLAKRDNSNKNFIIKGFITAIFLSAFIYLSYFGVENRLLNTVLGLIGLYCLLIISRKSLFIAGFVTGIAWFYFIAISLKYYDLIYLAPVLIFLIGIGYGVIFLLFGIIDNKVIRTLLIFGFTFIAPFEFNWMKFEVIFINSYFETSKVAFALILTSIYMLSTLKKGKLLAVIPLFLAINWPVGTYIDNLNSSLHMANMNTPQDIKWETQYKTVEIKRVINKIDKAIKDKKELIILPETALPTILNRNQELVNTLKLRSSKIDIVVGALLYENNSIYNATYHFSQKELKDIAKKVVLVPFGEKIPLPKVLVDLINDIFYDGASDYAKASKPTDFIIGGQKVRNAICYEATTDKIFENLNGVKHMIVTSNNAWFTPSIEPTLQKMLLKYYARKYDVTIYHVTNMSENYIVRP
ncbi:MAG: apolipoprotein N-acyltransferase [Campylobacterota bacterium]